MSVKKLMQEIGSDGLKCTVPGCKVTIWGMTGLQELMKLRQHMNRAHRARWNMGEALHNRVGMERENEARKPKRTAR